jgi:hypothetical protein
LRRTSNLIFILRLFCLRSSFGGKGDALDGDIIFPAATQTNKCSSLGRNCRGSFDIDISGVIFNTLYFVAVRFGIYGILLLENRQINGNKTFQSPVETLFFCSAWV